MGPFGIQGTSYLSNYGFHQEITKMEHGWVGHSHYPSCTFIEYIGYGIGPMHTPVENKISGHHLL